MAGSGGAGLKRRRQVWVWIGGGREEYIEVGGVAGTKGGVIGTWGLGVGARRGVATGETPSPGRESAWEEV